MFTLVTIGAFALEVAASEIQQRSLSGLLSRQNSGVDPSDIPSQCESECTDIVNAVNDCTTNACFCTSSNGSDMEDCMNCLVGLNPTSQEEQIAQTTLDDFNNQCSGLGLPTLTLSGAESGSGSGSSSSSSGSGSSGSSSGSGSGSGLKGLNGGAVSDKLSTTTATVGALSFIAGLALL